MSREEYPMGPPPGPSYNNHPPQMYQPSHHHTYPPIVPYPPPPPPSSHHPHLIYGPPPGQATHPPFPTPPTTYPYGVDVVHHDDPVYSDKILKRTGVLAPIRHRCPHCQKPFTRKSHLHSHLVTHSDRRDHSCDVCPATFARSHDLNRHRRTAHSEEREHRCPRCGVACKRKDSLVKHLALNCRGERTVAAVINVGGTIGKSIRANLTGGAPPSPPHQSPAPQPTQPPNHPEYIPQFPPALQYHPQHLNQLHQEQEQQHHESSIEQPEVEVKKDIATISEAEAEAASSLAALAFWP